MRPLKLISALAGLTLLCASAAQAAPGYSTADVNIRTGPDIDFPSAGVIPEGDSVQIKGCLDDESWCDVIWDGTRGWVYSEYLAVEQRGEYRPLPDVGLSTFRIPTITFVARTYWDRHYVSRPWYRDRARWNDFRIRPRVGWVAPPRGPRVPGWWRKGYQVAPGFRPPPERWQRIERRQERREERRELRQERREDRREIRQENRQERREERREDRRDNRR
ncbi:MAG: SH3 domain-containing protein [Hyphomicrobium sp.]